jgi:hypothetical protein
LLPAPVPPQNTQLRYKAWLDSLPPPSPHPPRPEYISEFYNVINWGKVGEYYATAAAGKPIEF